MFRRRQGYSKAHFRNISRRVNTATVGTHVARHSRHASHHPSGDKLEFSSHKRTARAHRGEIHQVLPNTSSRESSRAHLRRVGQLDLTAKATRRSKRKGVFIGVIVLALIVAVVASVSTFTYVGSVSSKMALGDDAVQSQLVAPAAGAPYYVLLAAPFADAGADDMQADLMILARIDQANKQVTLVNIPPNMEVAQSDGQFRPIRETYMAGGDSAIIKEVATFAGIPIAHYMKIDSVGLKTIVDALGGISLDVTEEVDDPNAGSEYIARGTQTLNGEQALTFCRARNFSKGTQTREANQLAFTVALSNKLLAVGTAALPATIDTLSTCIKTDYSAADLTGLVEAMRGIDGASIHTAQVPGSIYVNSDHERLFTVSSTGWKQMMSDIDGGQNPATAQAVPVESDPKSFTITVRNGSSVTGIAAETAARLIAAGFQVPETGNADSPVYGETLVIYKDPAKADAANSVVAALGGGRATDASTFYTFNTDILVMIGKDYAPIK
ncbi:MAG: LCP family protein [Raoultibacter sp.]